MLVTALNPISATTRRQVAKKAHAEGTSLKSRHRLGFLTARNSISSSDPSR